MSRKFNRSVSVTVTKRTETTGLNIKDLRITFEVTKDQLGYPNLAQIDIWNLNRDNQNRVRNESDYILLRAGYEDSEGLIFSGEIRNVLKVRQGADLITRIWAGSNDRDLENGVLNYTAGNNADINSIIQKSVESFEDVILGRVDELVGSKKIKGESYSGSTRSILDRLKEDYGFDWFIDDDKLNVLKPETTLNTERKAVIISSTTGMINVPALTERGVQVKTLLDHKLKIGKLVRIISQTREVQLGNLFFRDIDRTLGEGFYKVIKVIHAGDTHTNQWQSTIEGISHNG